MKKIAKKVLKYLLITISTLVISANLFAVLSGRFYLYNAVWQTYLHGESGVTIYDKEKFYHTTLNPGEGDDWKFHKDLNEQKISDEFRDYLEELETAAFLVIRGDTVLYEEYWDEHDQKTVSNSFSMAKTVVSLLIGVATEEGKISSLDDPVGKYLKKFKGGGKENISLRHLLTMSSGLSWGESGKNPLSDNAEGYYGWDLWGQTMRQEALTKPGVTFDYQGGSTELLAFVLEEATKMDLTDYAQQKIWSKIGAQDKAYWSLDDEGGNEKAFCCLYATARDFAKLGRLMLSKGKVNGEQIIPEWYYEEMITLADLKTKECRPNQRYGLHYWLYYGVSNPVQYYRGLLGQYIITMPEENLIIVRLGKKSKPRFEIPEHLKLSLIHISEPTRPY